MSHLPSLNALLNLTSALLLGAGYLFIRRKQVAAHRACMLAALCVSTLFLISYLTFHFHEGVVRYPRHDWLRAVYFSILIPHTLLAMATVPLVLRTAYLAMKGRFADHRKWARWTLPIWFYVSVTGVVIYKMLY